MQIAAHTVRAHVCFDDWVFRSGAESDKLFLSSTKQHDCRTRTSSGHLKMGRFLNQSTKVAIGADGFAVASFGIEGGIASTLCENRHGSSGRVWTRQIELKLRGKAVMWGLCMGASVIAMTEHGVHGIQGK